MKCRAKIHSIETLGAVDGPGLRSVVFFQGCPLRCKYCHNPDSQDFASGTECELSEIIAKLLRQKPYYGSNGGVTFSGGEPLCQPEALAELLRLCKQHGIHTAIDTSGCVADAKAIEAASLADMMILDIKHPDSKICEELTGRGNENALTHLDAAEKRGQMVWIRHVVVPGVSCDEESVRALARLLARRRCVRKIQLVPFHRLGEEKYKALNMEYPMGQTKDADKDTVATLQKLIDMTIQEARTPGRFR